MDNKKIVECLPSAHSLKVMPIIGYIVNYRKCNPDYHIECNLNRCAYGIAIGGPNSGNRWSKTRLNDVPTKKQINNNTYDGFEYHLFNTFEEMLEKFPFFYDTYVLLQPPNDLTVGKYSDRRLTIFEDYKRRGWNVEEYEEIYPPEIYKERHNTVTVYGSNVFFHDEVNV